MSQDYNFNNAYILGDGIGKLSRPELLEFARGVCRVLMDVEGKYHGNINPVNISRTPQGEVGLGPKADHGPGDWTSDELEYMAPELFWNHDGDATVDVYSVGLLLFAGVSGGKLPFFPEGVETQEPQDRASALRRRLSGDAITIPAEAGETLGSVIKKALTYAPEERYSGPVELLSALSDCPDSEKALPVIPILAEKAAPTIPEYKVDKNFEEKIPPKEKKNRKPLIIVTCICAAIIILALIINGLASGFFGEPKPSDGPDATSGTVTPSPSVDVSPSAEVSPSATPDASPSPTESENPEETAALSPSAVPIPTPTKTSTPAKTPTPTRTPTPTKTPAPTAAPTPTPTPVTESTYKLYIEDLSWTEAAEKCRKMGGHLVTISDAAELKKVTELADDNGIGLVWIGFYRDLSGQLVWLNDENIDYYVWRKGEPSVTDTDGTAENYGLLWKYGPLTGWIYNDSRNDPVSDYPSAYSGKIAYICEFEP